MHADKKSLIYILHRNLLHRIGYALNLTEFKKNIFPGALCVVGKIMLQPVKRAEPLGRKKQKIG
jgi:hypothetical protein